MRRNCGSELLHGRGWDSRERAFAGPGVGGPHSRVYVECRGGSL